MLSIDAGSATLEPDLLSKTVKITPDKTTSAIMPITIFRVTVSPDLAELLTFLWRGSFGTIPTPLDFPNYVWI
jgi:hypothetical protein